MNVIGPSEVHLWIIYADAFRDPQTAAGLAGLLDASESGRCVRLRRRVDREAFLVAHAHLRLVLSRYHATSPQDWHFTSSDLGRPEISNDVDELHFSLAHTRDVVAIAITRRAQVGVDVESLPDGFEPAELFSLLPPDEVDELERRHGVQRRDAFLECWTLKEAYLKARGIGLARGLDGVWFRPGGSAPRQCFAPGWDDDAARWSCRSLRAARGAHIAVAAAIPEDVFTLRTAFVPTRLGARS